MARSQPRERFAVVKMGRKKDFYAGFKKDNAFKKEDSPLIECLCGAILEKPEMNDHARICDEAEKERPQWEPDL